MAYGFMPVYEDEPEAQNVQVTMCRSCDHVDCEAMRRLRAGACPVCRKSFEPLDKYYDTDEGPVHYLCRHRPEFTKGVCN